MAIFCTRDVSFCVLQVRKRDVVLNFGSAASSISGASVRVFQMDSSFPFGACINPGVIQNPAFVDFFTKHFDWAVFENELKWYHTEAQQGQLNYADSDALLDFCDKYGKPVRGHCIFWAVENTVQQWVKNLNDDQLKSAVQERLQSLLTRYAGRFPHYDVNNEMLHGSYYRSRLGDDIDAFMFRETARLDPGATLFVNDYNVEGGNDPNATPEKYIEQIAALQQKGAAVGGIGLQGHVTNPVGEVICDALDKLSAATDLPVWLTELDVCESDVDLRAEDLEVVLREAYAHPAVEGVVFWGFMQGHMWRQDACLVNSDGTVNDAGERPVRLSINDSLEGQIARSVTDVRLCSAPAGSWISGGSGRRTRAATSTAPATSSSGGTTARTSCSSPRRRGRCTRHSPWRKGTPLSCWTWTFDDQRLPLPSYYLLLPS
jgi:GH35 family endo-1,4-beta-xylanase